MIRLSPSVNKAKTFIGGSDSLATPKLLSAQKEEETFSQRMSGGVLQVLVCQ